MSELSIDIPTLIKAIIGAYLLSLMYKVRSVHTDVPRHGALLKSLSTKQDLLT